MKKTLIILNLATSFVALGSLFLGINFGIGEFYHPQAYTRSIYLVFLTSFYLSGLVFIISLGLWFYRHTLTPKTIQRVIFIWLAVSFFIGTTTYFIQTPKPNEYEFTVPAGTFVIPRTHDPFEVDNTIYFSICENNPTEGKYESVTNNCQSSIQSLEPAISGLNRLTWKSHLFDPEYFSISTTTNTIVVNTERIDQSIYIITQLEQSDRVIITGPSTQSSGRIYVELEDTSLTWFTDCSVDCIHGQLIPGWNSYIVFTTPVVAFTDQVETLTPEQIQSFKNTANDIVNEWQNFKQTP